METYRLPNGKFTASVNVYLRTWRKLARVVEKHLNVKVHAFDPDFAVHSTKIMKSNGYRASAEIPLWLALSIQRHNKAP